MAGGAGAGPGPTTPAGIIPPYASLGLPGTPLVSSKPGLGGVKCDGPAKVIHCTPLTYHGGPNGVMKPTITDYSIFWNPATYSPPTILGFNFPAFDGNYFNVVNQYFTDIAADSGNLTNVFGVATQYCEGVSVGAADCAGASAGQYIQYHHVFGGSWTDTATNFPASGCGQLSSYTPVCLTNSQLITEINHAISVNAWTASATHMFFIYTPDGVESCFDAGGSSCSYLQYCAYHYNSGSGAGALIYANMSYPLFGPFDVCENVKKMQRPNGDDADAVISTTSHEANEANTDSQFPGGNASGWADDLDNVTGGENGDKCAYFYGKPTGPKGAQYNQVINGDFYYTQLEWSNADHNCESAPLAPTVKGPKPSKNVAPGTTIAVSGGNFYAGVTSVSVDGFACGSVTVTALNKLTCVLNGATPAGTWPVIVTTYAGSSSGGKTIVVT
jgi:hypothetical protein